MVIGEWDGSIEDAPTCHCLCEVIHPRIALCDVEEARALVSMDTEGTRRGPGRYEMLMCRPCAEATMDRHPRARDIVVLVAREKATQ